MFSAWARLMLFLVHAYSTTVEPTADDEDGFIGSPAPSWTNRWGRESVLHRFPRRVCVCVCVHTVCAVSRGGRCSPVHRARGFGLARRQGGFLRRRRTAELARAPNSPQGIDTVVAAHRRFCIVPVVSGNHANAQHHRQTLLYASRAASTRLGAPARK